MRRKDTPRWISKHHVNMSNKARTGTQGPYCYVYELTEQAKLTQVVATDESRLAGTPWDGGNTAPPDGRLGHTRGCICQNSLNCTTNVCSFHCIKLYLHNKQKCINNQCDGGGYHIKSKHFRYCPPPGAPMGRPEHIQAPSQPKLLPTNVPKPKRLLICATLHKEDAGRLTSTEGGSPWTVPATQRLGEWVGSR